MADSNQASLFKANSDTEARGRLSLVLALIGALLTGLIAISGDTFWIDEGTSVNKAIQPTFHAFWNVMIWDGSSNLQLPLYLCLLWGWEKIVGSGEHALRLLNLPFFLLAIFALWRTYGSNRRRLFFAVAVVLTSAFVWFYLDQLRPYSVLLCGSMFLFSSVRELASRERPDGETVWLLAISILWMAATSILALPWIVFAVLALCITRSFGFVFGMVRSFPLQATILFVGLFGLGWYYLWTLMLGSPTTPGTTDLASLVSIVYDFTGFAGLGPSRNSLRGMHLSAVRPYLPALAGFGAVWVLCLAVFVATYNRRETTINWKLHGTMLAPLPLLLIVADLHHTRLLARHLTPMWPILMAGVSGMLEVLWRRSTGKVLCVAFLTLSLISALEISFAPRHKRDDYRGACALAKEELKQGGRVYWAADVETAIYYGLIPEQARDNGMNNLYLRNRSPDSSISAVFLSKPDLYDPRRELLNYIQSHGFRQVKTLEAFTIWKK